MRASLLHYLWGIETLVLLNCTHVQVLVVTLPMRNWNKYMFYIRYYIYLSCYITYEELKPLFPTCPLPLAFSCYITYEELKQHYEELIRQEHISLLHYLWGIETFLLFLLSSFFVCCYITYEELKRAWFSDYINF